MQTRKKVLAKNASRDHATHKSCRQQKKVTVNTERKVTELITSSAKKQRNVGAHPRKSRDVQGAVNLYSSYALAEDENEVICVTHGGTLIDKPCDEKSASRETIFSPSFHLPKDACGSALGKGDFMDIFRRNDQADHEGDKAEHSHTDIFNYLPTIENHKNSTKNGANVIKDACKNGDSIAASAECVDKQQNHSHLSPLGDMPCDGDYRVLGNLSSEVSAIYLAMQHSKLECVDESKYDSMSTESCPEPDEDDELDDFDPYFFIKNLPDLSAVVPTFRPMLLPKQTRSCPSTTLVLDLDETLVHSTLEPCQDADFTFPVNFNLIEHTIYVRCRPFLKEFMEKVASMFEIIIFTASQSIYAEQLLNVLDPKRKLIRHRVFRDSCVYVEGNYLKDLSVLGRDLARVIIIDNSPQAFGFQVDNGIPIESWFDDRSDRELLHLLPFLENLAGVEDVRPLIAQRFNLRDKIAASDCLLVNSADDR